jgi:hypothetical protein
MSLCVRLTPGAHIVTLRPDGISSLLMGRACIDKAGLPQVYPDKEHLS